MTDDDDIRENILPPLELPPFLPTKDIHYNWVFWRLYSEEIYSTFEKHQTRFDGEYLSRYLLGEIFHEKINDEDGEFDTSVFFQAVEVKKVHPAFEYGRNRKRVVVDCEEIRTSKNAHVSAARRKRKVLAEESLSDLLTACLKEGDLMVIFGDIHIEKSSTIALNSRYEHRVTIAHYRHDRNFGPVVVESGADFEDIAGACLNPAFCHAVHELENSEYAIRFSPNVVTEEEDEAEEEENEAENGPSSNGSSVSPPSPRKRLFEGEARLLTSVEALGSRHPQPNHSPNDANVEKIVEDD